MELPKNNNYFKITNIFFILAILIFSITSLFHVTVFWLITNSLFLAIIMSVGTGLGIISSLLSTRYTKLTYISFFLIILIELFGNIYGAFIHIDITSEYFKGWKELMQPLFAMFYPMEDGAEIPDAIYKRWVAIIQGSFIPLLLSITFHMWMVLRDKYNLGISNQNKPIEPKKEKTQETNLISEFLNVPSLNIEKIASNLTAGLTAGINTSKMAGRRKNPIENKAIDNPQSEEKKKLIEEIIQEEIIEQPVEEIIQEEIVQEEINSKENNSIETEAKTPNEEVKRNRVIKTKSSDFGNIVLKPKEWK